MLLRARDVSDAHIKTLLAAVRKLVWGMRELGWITMQPDDLVPEALNEGLIASAPRGSYSEEQITQLRLFVAAQRQASELLRLFDLILASGLRHDEAARLWESDLTRQDGFVRVRGTDAKGGRECTTAPDLDRDGASHSARPSLPFRPAGTSSGLEGLVWPVVWRRSSVLAAKSLDMSAKASTACGRPLPADILIDNWLKGFLNASHDVVSVVCWAITASTSPTVMQQSAVEILWRGAVQSALAA